MTRKRRLGRGLEALLNAGDEMVPGNVAVVEAGNAETAYSATGFANSHVEDDDNLEDRILHLSVYEIEENPFQPRREFNEPEIAALAESLKEHNLLQPIVVRIVEGRYQLISGERRLRAAIKANWRTIPARVREADDRLVSELAIVENLQRKDLNAIEKALSFRRYLDEHRCTQEYLAERLKLDRSTVANLMRLLELPAQIQDWICQGKIAGGHARALLPLGDEKIQIEFAEQIIKEGMAVRAVEAAVGELLAAEDSLAAGATDGYLKKRRTMDAQIESLEYELKQALGTKVKLKYGTRQKGQIIVYFTNSDEFDRIRGQLTGR